jgi:predicted DNA-binding transcriptional regulator AlpA
MSEPKKVIPLRPDTSADDNRPAYTLTVAELRAIIRNEIAAHDNTPASRADVELVNAKRAAAMLGVSPEWLFHHHKELPFTRKISAKMLRFDLAGLHDWIQSKRR